MKHLNFSKWQLLLILLLALLLTFGAVGPAVASDIRGGDVVQIAAGQVIDDDLVLMGNSIIMNGTVNGDLVAFGNQITVNGTVNGSAMLSGQTINVGGTIKGSLYSGAGALYLHPNAVVERNVMFGGLSFQTDPGSVIARDLTAGGMQAILSGKVGRDVQFGGQALELNGEIGRNVRAEVAEPGQTPTGISYGPNMPAAVASGLRVGKDAKIGGQLTYASTLPQADEILAVPAAGVTFQQQQIESRATVAESPYEWLFTRVRDFFTVLILGALALWLAPRWMNTAAANAEHKTLAATGWGLLVLIAGYVIAGIALIAILALGIALASATLGGLAFSTFVVGLSGLGLAVTVFTGIVLWGAKVVVAFLIGKLLLRQFAPNYADNAAFAFVLGLVLFEIVAAIPVVGWIMTLVAVLLGLGALWYVYYQRGKPIQTPTPQSAPIPA